MKRKYGVVDLRHVPECAAGREIISRWNKRANSVTLMPMTFDEDEYRRRKRITMTLFAMMGAMQHSMPDLGKCVPMDITGRMKDYISKALEGWDSVRNPRRECDYCGGTGKTPQQEHRDRLAASVAFNVHLPRKETCRECKGAGWAWVNPE